MDTLCGSYIECCIIISTSVHPPGNCMLFVQGLQAWAAADLKTGRLKNDYSRTSEFCILHG